MNTVKNYHIKIPVTKRGSGVYKYNYIQWDISDQLDVHSFLKNHPKCKFESAGKIVANEKKTCGYEIVVDQKWKDKKYIVYLVVINGKIIKGGKSKNPIPIRTYGAGTEKNLTEKGSPSVTNYFYSQLFRECLKKGDVVEFYCHQAQVRVDDWDELGDIVKGVTTSRYEEVEVKLNALLVKALGRKPIGEGNLLQRSKK
jgi:hypothetical protein